MAESNVPRMPMSASSNMMMSLSTVATLSSDIATDSPTPPSASSSDSQHATMALRTRASTIMADVPHDSTRSREKTLSIQRIQLAEQLSKKTKLCRDLEAHIAILQDELAGLTSSHKDLEDECRRLQAQTEEAAQQLESQVTGAYQRDKALLERVSDLETKLDEAVKSLEQATLSRDTLQRSHDELVETCAEQANEAQKQAQKLADELETDRAKLHDLTVMYDQLKQKYDNDVTLAISKLEKSHESRERDLQQRLSRKGKETKELKRELNAIKTACADAVAKKEALQKELRDQEKLVVEARDESVTESQKLQQSLDELDKSVETFDQTVVICVDVSASASCVAHDIQNAYRDVLHAVNSFNKNARVGVVIHGDGERHDPHPVQAICDATFQFIDALDSTGGTEDYTYCLDQAEKLCDTYPDSRKLILLIGDGNAMCSNVSAGFQSCDQLKSARIPAHSIVFASDSWFNLSPNLTMQDISKATGGRVMGKDTYLVALYELLRHEREQHFDEDTHLY